MRSCKVIGAMIISKSCYPSSLFLTTSNAKFTFAYALTFIFHYLGYKFLATPLVSIPPTPDCLKEVFSITFSKSTYSLIFVLAI